MKTLLRSKDYRSVRRVLGGQREAFAELVDRHLPGVFAVAMAHTGNADDAEDIAQETFIQALRGLNGLREPSKFGVWVGTIARNSARSLSRSRTRENEAIRRATTETERTQAIAPLEDDETRALVRAQVKELDAAHREVLMLHYFADMKTADIARQLEISPAAARKRLQRAREALGTHLLPALRPEEESQARLKARKSHILAAALAASVPWKSVAAGGLGMLLPALGKSLVGMVAVTLLSVAAWYAVSQDKAEQTPSPTSVVSVSNVLENSEPKTAVSPPPAVTDEKALPEEDTGIPNGPGIIWGTVFGLDGQPMAGAEVNVAPMSNWHSTGDEASPFPKETTRTNAAGEYRFGSLEFAHYNLLARAPGGAITAQFASLDKDFLEKFVWLELEAVERTRGRVVDPQGKPIPNATILAMTERKTGRGAYWKAAWPVKTDAVGAFSLDSLEPKEWKLVVQAPGWAAQVSDLFHPGDALEDIALNHGGGISGRVVDAATGEGLAEVSLDIRLTEPWKVRRSVETDTNGAFETTALMPGPYTLSVATPYLLADMDEVACDVKAGQTLTTQVLEARRGASISGRVYHASTEEGLVGMRVQIEDPRKYIGAHTDETGAYRIEGLRPGAYTVRWQYGGLDKKQVEVGGEEQVTDIDFTVAEGGIQIAGTVVDGESRPLSGVEVEAFGQVHCTLPRKTFTDGLGRFELAGLESADQFWVRAIKPGWKGSALSTKLTNRGLGDIKLSLQPTATLLGRVVDANDRPLSEITVWARSRDIQGYTNRGSRTTKGGRFAFAQRAPGKYMVSCRREGTPDEVCGEVELAPGELRTDFEVVYEPRGNLEITGSVVDPTGQPVPNTWLNVQGHHTQIGMIATDLTGKFVVRGLAEGRYEVRFVHQDYAHAKLKEVQAGADDIVVQLERYGKVSGRVINANTRRPMPEFFFTLLEGARTDLERYQRDAGIRVSNASGAYSIPKARPGRGTLVAWADGFAPAFEVFDLAGGATLNAINLALFPAEEKKKKTPEKTVQVSGVVLNEAGHPLREAFVYMESIPHPSDRQGMIDARTDERGRFTVKNVPVSVDRVFAGHPDYAVAGVAVALRAGHDKVVEIRLPRAGMVRGTVSRDGEALSRVWVSAGQFLFEEGCGGRYYDNDNTDGDGRFEIAGLPPGENKVSLHVSVGAYAHRTYEQEVFLSADTPSRVDFDLLSGDGAIEGRLLQGDKGLSGSVHIFIPLENGEEEHSQVNTDEEGGFRIERLPEGLILLKGHTYLSGARYVGEVEVEVVSGETVAADIPVEEAMESK
jgi:RNA polymerase sigma-70 factor, ECF subfamily